MIAALLKLVCQMNGLLHKNKFKYSQETEGNAEFMSFDYKLWWGYKYFYHPVEKAKKGKNIEQYLRKKNLKFDLPQNFEDRQYFKIMGRGGRFPV